MWLIIVVVIVFVVRALIKHYREGAFDAILKKEGVEEERPDVGAYYAELVESKIVSSAVFQKDLQRMKNVHKVLCECANGCRGDKNGQGVRVEKSDKDKFTISFDRLIFDVHCHHLQEQRGAFKEPEDWHKKTHECLLDICGSEDAVKELTQVVGAAWFLDNIQPFDGDYREDTYVVSYPLIVNSCGYTKAEYPYDIRDLYLREFYK